MDSSNNSKLSSSLESNENKSNNLKSPSEVYIYNSTLSKKRSEFQTNLLILKKHLGYSPQARKARMDSLLKKCKCKFFKSVHLAIKKCVSFKLKKLPQNFITDIKIESNKVYMSKTISEIYQEYKIFPTLDALFERKQVKEEKKDLFKEFVSYSMKESFGMYLSSGQYVKDYENLREKENKDFAILFNYVSKIFVQYYECSCGNMSRLVDPEELNYKLEKKEIKTINNEQILE